MIIAACVDDWEDADDLLTMSEVLRQMARELVTRRGMHATSLRSDSTLTSCDRLQDGCRAR